MRTIIKAMVIYMHRQNGLLSARVYTWGNDTGTGVLTGAEFDGPEDGSDGGGGGGGLAELGDQLLVYERERPAKTSGHEERHGAGEHHNPPPTAIGGRRGFLHPVLFARTIPWVNKQLLQVRFRISASVGHFLLQVFHRVSCP